VAEAGDASHAEEEDENEEAEKVAASLLEMTGAPLPAIGDAHDDDNPSDPHSPSDDISPSMPSVKVLSPIPTSPHTAHEHTVGFDTLELKASEYLLLREIFRLAKSRQGGSSSFALRHVKCFARIWCVLALAESAPSRCSCCKTTEYLERNKNSM